MSLRKQAQILGTSHANLSRMINGKRPWNPELKARYEALVGTTFGTTTRNEDSLSTNNMREAHAYDRHDGGAGENRTLYLFNAIEALSQMSYSPT